MTTTLITAKTDKVALAKAQFEAVEKITALQTTGTVKPIMNEAQYALADTRLGAAKGLKKWWGTIMDPPIAKVREALDLMYASRKEVSDRIESVIATETGRMRTFKLAEMKRLQAEQTARDIESRRLESIAQAKLKAASMAKRASTRERLVEEAAEMQVEAQTIEEAPALSGVEAKNSTDRVMKRFRVTDMEKFLTHVVSTFGTDGNLISTVAVDGPQLNAFFKIEDPKVGDWMPGVEVYNDIIIAKRRG